MEFEKKSKNRELRAINRDFSLGEYGQSWTKVERYLFIEIYNVVKEFFLAISDDNISSYSSESIELTLPIGKLDKKLFNTAHKNRDLLKAAEGLSTKQINIKTINEFEQIGFDFISMFPRIKYDPDVDKKNMYVRIQSEVYEKMLPIESFCLLDLKMISEFNSGNTIRLYEIFKSYAFKKNITLTFERLRRLLGFYREESYTEWKYFNSQVLKKAVASINKHKEFDIEVLYNKAKGSNDIDFTIITHKKLKPSDMNLLKLDVKIENRELNLIQSKYVTSTLKKCNLVKKNRLNINELTEWVISDLVSSQSKLGNDFDFKHSMNAISKQIRSNTYTRPFSHNHLAPPKIQFNEDIYNEIKKLVSEGAIEEVKNQFSHEVVVTNGFGYIF